MIKQLPRTALQYYIRYFPVSKGKYLLMNSLWKALSFGEYCVDTKLMQADVNISCDITKYIQRHIYFWGGYEQQNCDYWIKLSKKSNTIFDVGANIGLYSLLAAKSNPNASVHAFEPTPNIIDLLNRNIIINKINNITVNNTAIGNRSGMAILRDCRGENGCNEGMNYVEYKNNKSLQDDMSVEIVSIDEYCEKLEIGYIDIMKIDIEGGEYNALMGAKNMLKKKQIGCIMVEFIEWALQRSGYSTDELRQFLLNEKYRLFLIKDNKIKEILQGEVLDGVNVYAVSPDFNLF